MAKLHGIITSLLTPFNERDRLDEETLAQELEHQVQAGVHGICVLGGTGESLSLSTSERERAVEVTTKVVAGRIPVVVGCFIPREDEIVEFARRCQDLGATALMLTPPAFYKATASQFQRLLERISERCSLPLVVYNAPSRAGVKLRVHEICRLVQEVTSIVGVKDAAADMPDFIRLADGFGPDCALLQALDDVFLPSLAAGADGGILALASVFPERFVSIYQDWQDGAVEKAVEQQLELVPVMSVINREPMPVLVKEAMTMVGRPMGPTRPPLYSADPEAVNALRAEVERLAGG